MPEKAPGNRICETLPTPGWSTQVTRSRLFAWTSSTASCRSLTGEHVRHQSVDRVRNREVDVLTDACAISEPQSGEHRNHREHGSGQVADGRSHRDRITRDMLEAGDGRVVQTVSRLVAVRTILLA